MIFLKTKLIVRFSFYCSGYAISFVDPPIVSLSLGEGLSLSRLVEGSDVYFECLVSANPPLNHIRWTLNDRELPQDPDIVLQVRCISYRMERVVGSG